MWIVNVELGGKPDGRFFLGNPTSEVTVGRPPAKATETPDVVVHEKSVSKVHALLVLAADGSRLIFHDRSRYGTTINGVKHQGGSVPLSDGDRAQLAPKAFLTFREHQLVVCVPEGHGALADMQRAAHTVGARLTHVYDNSVTHVVAGQGAHVWSGVVMAALYGKPLVQENWLGELTSKRVWAEQLPAGAPPARLVVPCSPPLEVEVEADPMAGGRLAALQRGTLAGLAFAPGSQWRDAGLPVCIVALGGKVVPPGEVGQAGAPRGPVALVLGEGEEETEPACGGWSVVVRAPELLACMMRSDASALRQRLEALEGARAGGGAAAAAAGGAGAGVAAGEGGDDMIEDSDLTEMADDEEGPGEEVQQAPAPGGQQQQQPHGKAAAAPGTEEGGRGRPAARPAGPGGWFGGALHGANGSAPAAGAAPGPHPDAPEPKRRRINSGAAQPAPAVPLTTAAAPSAAPAATSEPDASQAAIREQRARAQARTALAAAAAAAAAEHGVELPWLSTQHPGSSPPAAARRGGAAATPMPPAHTPAPDPDTKPQRGTLLGLLQPKQEPGSAGQATGPAAATGSRRAGGAKGKKAAAADAALDGLPPVRGIVKKEEEAEGGTQAGALNASAQAVVEVPLVAGSGDAAADGVALPGWPALSDGDPGGGSQGAGNFKRFRKQGQQLPPSQVEPLGVVPVEAFKEDEQTAEFLRQEQERAARKRRADDMFRSANAGAGAGGRRPPRAPKRG